MQRLIVFLLVSLSLAASAQGVSSTEIVIGQTGGFTGPVATQVQEMTAGAKLYIDHINTAGGVNGRKIRLESMDDAFLPPRAGENAKALIEEKKVFALFLVRGTPHTEAVMPHARKAGVPVIAPSTGAGILHEPLDPLIFNVRSKYQGEAEKAIVQLATQGIKTVVVIHVDDSFGKDGLKGYEKGFKAAGITPAGVFSFDQTTGDSKDAIAKTLAIKPQAVVMQAPVSMWLPYFAHFALPSLLRRSSRYPTTVHRALLKILAMTVTAPLSCRYFRIRDGQASPSIPKCSVCPPAKKTSSFRTLPWKGLLRQKCSWKDCVAEARICRALLLSLDWKA